MSDKEKNAQRRTQPQPAKREEAVEKRGGYRGSPVEGPVPTPTSPGATVNQPSSQRPGKPASDASSNDKG